MCREQEAVGCQVLSARFPLRPEGVAVALVLHLEVLQLQDKVLLEVLVVQQPHLKVVAVVGFGRGQGDEA